MIGFALIVLAAAVVGWSGWLFGAAAAWLALAACLSVSALFVSLAAYDDARKARESANRAEAAAGVRAFDELEGEGRLN